MDDHAQIHESALPLAEREMIDAQHRVELAALRLSFERRVDSIKLGHDHLLKEARRFPWATAFGAFGAGVSLGAWLVQVWQTGLHP